METSDPTALLAQRRNDAADPANAGADLQHAICRSDAHGALQLPQCALSRLEEGALVGEPADTKLGVQASVQACLFHTAR